MKLKFFNLMTLVCLLGVFTNCDAVTLPSGFSQVLVAAGLTMPTTMTGTPDGRFFVAQQNGLLRVVKNDTLLAQPFITLSVNIDGERGLLGVAVDPDFSVNQYIYLCYTVPSGLYNVVSRFTASGDTVVPGSEVQIIQLDTLIANYHTGGHLEFGPDGTLYIATGENGRPAKSQNLNSYLGKILRINKDGSVPFDNPFIGPGKQQRIWAYGLRNPFTFAFQPGTGKLFIDDVGEITWEEINDGTTGGGNYGWPTAEGMSNDTNFINPFYTYLHGTGVGQGCAITGGTFFNPDTTSYPSVYNDKYFYIDYCGNWIDMITLTNPPTRTTFATNIPFYSVGIRTSPSGELYFLSRNDEAMYKIVYSTNPAPIILNDPNSRIISVNYPVTFSATASGSPTLNYQWQFNTVDITGATSPDYTIPSVAYTDSGDYRVVVTNGFGNTTSNDAHLTVTANQPPIAVIDTPLTNSLYSAGEVINFHGSSTDPEDGALIDTTYRWLVVFHHDTHVHPGPTIPAGISGGTFTIPDVGEKSANVFYRLYLIATDSQGFTDSAYVDIYPRTANITLNSQPAGISLLLDGQPFVTPYSVLSVQGMYRSITAPYTAMYGQSNVLFTKWSNNGTLNQYFPTPTNDSTFTAIYDSIGFAYNLGNDTIICQGSGITIDAGAGLLSYAWNDGTVSQYQTLQSATVDTITVGVTVVNSSGLTGNDSLTVIFDICNGIDNVSKEDFIVYPIPSSGIVNIAKKDQDYYLEIYDLLGKSIYKKSLIHSNEFKQISLNPGIYSFVFTNQENSQLLIKKVSIVK